MKVTLDTNCILALENNEPTAPSIRQLVSLHDAGKVSLQIVATSASELKPGREHPTNFNDFEQKIAAVGLAHIEILPTLAYPGMAFPNGKYYPTGGQAAILERKIYDAIFQNSKSNFDSLTWSQRCDILALWSHIRFDGDIFVTADERHLLKKKKQLQILGAGQILNPQDAIFFIQTSLLQN